MGRPIFGSGLSGLGIITWQSKTYKDEHDDKGKILNRTLE